MEPVRSVCLGQRPWLRRLSIYLSIYLPIYLPTYLPIYLSASTDRPIHRPTTYLASGHGWCAHLTYRVSSAISISKPRDRVPCRSRHQRSRGYQVRRPSSHTMARPHLGCPRYAVGPARPRLVRVGTPEAGTRRCSIQEAGTRRPHAHAHVQYGGPGAYVSAQYPTGHRAPRRSRTGAQRCGGHAPSPTQHVAGMGVPAGYGPQAPCDRWRPSAWRGQRAVC